MHDILKLFRRDAEGEKHHDDEKLMAMGTKGRVLPAAAAAAAAAANGGGANVGHGVPDVVVRATRPGAIKQNNSGPKRDEGIYGRRW